MRTVSYYVATSVDGFIAHPDGSYDSFRPDPDFNEWFAASLARFDTVLMGRATYEVGLEQGVTSPYPQISQQIVFSTTLRASPDPAVTVTAQDPVRLLSELRQGEGGDIWVCGGGVLSAQLLRAGLIDELIVKVNPFIMGEGIPLFAQDAPTTQMELVDGRSFDSGIHVATYRVIARPPRSQRRGTRARPMTGPPRGGPPPPPVSTGRGGLRRMPHRHGFRG